MFTHYTRLRDLVRLSERSLPGGDWSGAISALESARELTDSLIGMLEDAAFADSGPIVESALDELTDTETGKADHDHSDDSAADSDTASSEAPRTPDKTEQEQKTQPTPIDRGRRRRGRDFTKDPIVDMQGVAYNPPDLTDDERSTDPDPTVVEPPPDDDEPR